MARTISINREVMILRTMDIFNIFCNMARDYQKSKFKDIDGDFMYNRQRRELDEKLEFFKDRFNNNSLRRDLHSVDEDMIEGFTGEIIKSLNNANVIYQ